MLFDFYFANFNFLCFISTPSNHSPICIWFYLRYKIRKIIQSLVLSFFRCFEGSEFPPSFSFSVFLLLLGRKPVARILHQLCKVLLPISLVVHKCITRHWGMLQECTPGLYRVLRSISITITKILACVVQVDAFIISLSIGYICIVMVVGCWFFK